MTEARPHWMARFILLSALIHLLMAFAFGLRPNEAFSPQQPIRVRMVEIPKPAEEVEPEETDILAPFSSRASALRKPLEESSSLEGPAEALPLPRQGERLPPSRSERSSPEVLSRPVVIPSPEAAERPEAGSAPEVQQERGRDVPERQRVAVETREREVPPPAAEPGRAEQLKEAEEPLEGGSAAKPQMREAFALQEEQVKQRSPRPVLPAGKSLSTEKLEIPAPGENLSPKPEPSRRAEETEVPSQAGRLMPGRGPSGPEAEEAFELTARAPVKPAPDRALSPEELKEARNLIPPKSAKEMLMRSPVAGRLETSMSLRGGERAEEGSSPDLYNITEEIQDKLASLKEKGSVEDAGRAISLDTKEWKYVSYMAHIKRRIELVWGYPGEAARAGMSGRLYLKFVLNEDGSLMRISLLESSGHKVLDDEALSAVSKAAPFNPFPSYFERKHLPITATFEYRISPYPAE